MSHTIKYNALTETQKAKADNKYFATMREQDALKAVKSSQSREIAKQNKVIERLLETERSLNLQLVCRIYTGFCCWVLTCSSPISKRKISFKRRK